jgi:hypothetical protein
MTRRTATRALLAATIAAPALAAAAVLTVVVVGSMTAPFTSRHMLAALFWFAILTASSWPVLFTATLVLYQWPDVGRSAFLWATGILVAFTAVWIYADLNGGKALEWGRLGLAWLILWPMVFGLTVLTHLGNKLGEAVLRMMRKPEDQP